MSLAAMVDAEEVIQRKGRRNNNETFITRPFPWSKGAIYKVKKFRTTVKV